MSDSRRLVDGIARGDAALFRAFYDQNAERLLRFVHYRVGGDVALAEEILQEAFARLCADPGAVGRLPGDAMLVPWMFGMLRRIIADWARSRARGRCISLDSLDPGVQEALLQGEEDEPPADALAHPQMQALVGMVLSLLSPVHAAVLRAKYVEGLAVEEIAVRCNASAKVIEGRLYRAREAFRAAFAQVRADLEAGDA
ncbi:MAG: RNA polymerase sigma factor [Planctomycetes bacterium]|nr:RNA polymerase sigma factor [Planctomycetota bacterium]